MSAISMTLPMSVSTPKGRILCVDDEPNILRALSWLLQKEFEVVTAASGAEALALVRIDDFDVVISDQRMPEMSGVDFLCQVRSLAPRAMRILLTGYSDRQAILRSVNETEIFRYINKPWDIVELPRVVAQAAEIARTQSALPADCIDPSDDADLAGAGEHILLVDDDHRMRAMAALAVGDVAKITHVTNLLDAVHTLHAQDIGIIISEVRVGNIDATRLIRLMKQRHPEIVTVMVAEEGGADTVSALINQGQIYRFVPKPVKAGYLKIILRSAIAKRLQLRQVPALAQRHHVDDLDADLAAEFEVDLRRQSPATNRAPADGGGSVSLASRVSSAVRRFFRY